MYLVDTKIILDSDQNRPILSFPKTQITQTVSQLTPKSLNTNSEQLFKNSLQEHTETKQTPPQPTLKLVRHLRV